jgi:hypothetical protein
MFINEKLVIKRKFKNEFISKKWMKRYKLRNHYLAKIKNIRNYNVK